MPYLPIGTLVVASRTAVVAFGVAILIAVLGFMFLLLGLAVLELDRRTAAALEEAPQPAITKANPAPAT